jgi:acetyl-CoA carboxylase biotin carboxylase subunit
LLAKLIVRGKDRMEAISRGRRALEQFVVEGVKTTIPLHRAILNNEQFIRGDISTRFMDNFSL